MDQSLGSINSKYAFYWLRKPDRGTEVVGRRDDAIGRRDIAQRRADESATWPRGARAADADFSGLSSMRQWSLKSSYVEIGSSR
jgi:hypothetical protein